MFTIITAPTCKANEVYTSCVNGGCGRWNCSQLGEPELCIDPIEGGCIQGCICADGYLRAENGTCVPTAECRKLKINKFFYYLIYSQKVLNQAITIPEKK